MTDITEARAWADLCAYSAAWKQFLDQNPNTRIEAWRAAEKWYSQPATSPNEETDMGYGACARRLVAPLNDKEETEAGVDDDDEETEHEAPASEEAELLDEAKDIVVGPRAEAYGPAEDSLLTIANLWQDYLYVAVGADGIVSPQDVAHMLILMKIARQAHSHKRDNLVDIAGYAALSQRISVARKGAR
jgi:hypothetical protein